MTDVIISLDRLPSFFLFLGTLGVAVLVAGSMEGPDGFGDREGLIFLAVFAALSSVYFLVGRLTRFGWLARQAIGQLGVALLLFCFYVGKHFSWWHALGMLVALALVVGIPYLILQSWFEQRARLKVEYGGRRRLAQANGWSYTDLDRFATGRWTESLGPAESKRIVPLGVVSGELDGLPFVFFDTPTTNPGVKSTGFVVFLPTAYPTATLSGGSATTPGFADALLTPDVRRLTQQLSPVHVDGRDVFHLGRHRHDLTGIVETLRTLVAVAQAFPPHLAQQYGRAPETTVPRLARRFAEPKPA